MNSSGYANPARLGERFEPRSDIDPVAEDVAVLDDDISLMDADAQLDAVIGRSVDAPAANFPLDLDSAAECIDDAGKFDEESVAGRLDQPAAMCGDRPVDHTGPDRPEPIQRAFFVSSDQP